MFLFSFSSYNVKCCDGIFPLSWFRQSTTAINDYLSGSLKLKVASCSLWRSLQPGSELPTFLLSAVHDLFEQVVKFMRLKFNLLFLPMFILFYLILLYYFIL